MNEKRLLGLMPWDGACLENRYIKRGDTFLVELWEDGEGKLSQGEVTPSSLLAPQVATVWWERDLPKLQAEVQTLLDGVSPQLTRRGEALELLAAREAVTLKLSRLVNPLYAHPQGAS